MVNFCGEKKPTLSFKKLKKSTAVKAFNHLKFESTVKDNLQFKHGENTIKKSPNELCPCFNDSLNKQNDHICPPRSLGCHGCLKH